MNKRVYFNGIVVFLFTCLLGTGWSQGTTNISGKIKKARGTMIYLLHENNNSIDVIDSCKVNFFGRYSMKVEVERTGFYRLTNDKKEYLLLILDGGESIKINSSKDFSDKNYSVKGSKESQLIQQYLAVKTNKSITKDS